MKNIIICQRSITFSLLLIAAAFSSWLAGSAVAAEGDVYVSVPPLIQKVAVNGSKITIPATILTPTGVVTDKAGNLYVADTTTHSIVKIDSNGNQTVVASGLSNPQGLALDPQGNLYVANSGTNSILKIAPNGTKTTVASGLSSPQGLAFDETGNLYVSNAGNNTIAKIGTNGAKTTFVSASLNSPQGLAFDGSGNLLIADSGGNKILKVTPNGTVSAAVSTGLNSPQDVAVNEAGDLLIANAGTHSILKVTPSGTITTLVSTLTSPQFLAQATVIHQLLNISTRGYVQTGDHVLIGGFIVRGTPVGDLGQTQVLIRAIGPSLAKAHVSDPLEDPTLDLYNSAGKIIAINNNWKDSQQAAIQATGLAPTDARESAILVTLPDGDYTAIVRGVNDTVGTGLVEVYKIQ